MHLFGAVCDMSEISRIARSFGMVIIEDASQAHGSEYKRKKAGSFGDLAVFSFYPTKNLGAYGDGGMILTDDSKIAGLLRLLRNYGKKSNPFDSEILGHNSRLDEVQAAVLSVKLNYLDKMNEERAKIADIYKKGLKGLPLSFLSERHGARSNNHIFTLVVCEKNRDDLMKFLEQNGVQTNVYYPKPLHLMKAFSAYVRTWEKFPVSEKMSRRMLALPIYPELKQSEAYFIIEKIKDFFKKGQG